MMCISGMHACIDVQPRKVGCATLHYNQPQPIHVIFGALSLAELVWYGQTLG